MIQRLLATFIVILTSQTALAQQLQPKIVGGEDASSSWHNVVALISKERIALAIENNWPLPVFQGLFCGGTLLSEEWVLTAAHCVDGLAPGDISIMVGSQSLDIGADSSYLKDVSEININPLYNSFSNRNDIALLRLSDQANPGLATVNTAVLALADTDSALENEADYDNILSALGWGVMTYEQRDEDPELEEVYPDTLQHVTLDYVTNTSCQALYNSSLGGTIFNSMLCANEPDPDEGDTFGEDSCTGDSGGPLFITSNPLDNSPLAGITSFGGDCGDALVPGVYTRVSHFLDWIEVTSSVTGIELRNLAIGEDNGQNQGINSFPVTIPVANHSSLSATNFTLSIQRSKNLTLAANEPGLSCTMPSTNLTECEYSGEPIPASDTKALHFTANDGGSRSSGTEQLNVTVTLDKHRDYHRLDNNGSVTLYFGEPIIGITAEAVCLTPGSNSSEMQIEASLSNSSNQIDSRGTIVSTALPDAFSLIGNASPACQFNSSEVSCDIGEVEAESSGTITIAVAAVPDTQSSLSLLVSNDNGIAVGSSPAFDINLDFTREDLPSCPSTPAPISNLTNGGGSSGGGGSIPLLTLISLLITGLRKSRSCQGTSE